MTEALITVDTELSALFHQRGMAPQDNFASSILGRCAAGEFGIGWQMDQLDRFALKGVFFVDPMPALIHGEALLAQIVGPIIARGHEVQLHIHTEWLEWAENSPVGQRIGRNLGDFGLDDQIALLKLASDLLQRAGAPPPVALRAGNFGANDDSLRAAAANGLRFDSSFNPGFLGSDCRISLDPALIDPVDREGVMEFPVSGLFDRPGHFRAAQVCALSRWEMAAALRHAVQQRQSYFTIVTHSFEMLSRDRQRPNRAVMARFEAMCRIIAETAGLGSTGFADIGQSVPSSSAPARLASNPLRTGLRIAEQAFGTWRYERRLLPA